ncbi:hypothetical protein [Sediminibacillus albus]|uniref:Uncharacterized protein n=1 Tax=Sediminibacillus albus TaxID=407036 RepID=A0A1G8WVL6_9BACI|nr:hypothetical protein [Sediminibacillus albus]SDJ82223.1 hypothetical protein SAMN05216243_1016 [Sediminibacillus albus]
MPKRQRGFKMGWFGWTLSALAITLVGACLFFYLFFDLGASQLFNNGEQAETSNQQQTDQEGDDTQSQEELEAKAEETRETVGKEYENVGEFVSDTHSFYNDTTGYGRIDNLDWSEQTAKAEEILDTLNAMLPEVEDEALKSDLQEIERLANVLIEEQQKGQAKSLHRMFHDLDIALNDYKGTDKIWGVTKTLQ